VVLVTADVLQSSAAATIVRREVDRLRIQDGPFAETKEQLTGAFTIMALTRNLATRRSWEAALSSLATGAPAFSDNAPGLPQISA
jgi:hypothetical protein